MEFINKTLDYFKANPVFAAVILACVVFIAIVVVVICVLSAKAKKAKQTLSTPTPSAPVKTTEQAVVQEEEKVETQVEVSSCQTEEQSAPAPAIPEKQTVAQSISAPVQVKEEKPMEKKATKAKPVEKPQAASPANKPAPQPVNKAKNSRYNGKWTICHLITKDENLGENSEEETYFFELLASNGEKLLSSEEYTSYNGVLKGIETHKSNILKNNFRIGLSKKGEYIFKLLNGKNSLLCTGENYPTKVRCENAIESTKRFAQTAVLDENVHDIIVQIPLDDEEPEEYDSGYIGKWIISKTTANDGDEVYYFELFASNGEKLLSSEEYTTYTGALNGINTHKNNIERDNFRIALTKRGDYIYKLLTGNGQLLCLGEHYKTRRRCESAVESVKRFAKSAPILTASNIAPKNE